jgi:hypothetical protein
MQRLYPNTHGQGQRSRRPTTSPVGHALDPLALEIRMDRVRPGKVARLDRGRGGHPGFLPAFDQRGGHRFLRVRFDSGMRAIVPCIVALILDAALVRVCVLPGLEALQSAFLALGARTPAAQVKILYALAFPTNSATLGQWHWHCISNYHATPPFPARRGRLGDGLPSGGPSVARFESCSDRRRIKKAPQYRTSKHRTVFETPY